MPETTNDINQMDHVRWHLSAQLAQCAELYGLDVQYFYWETIDEQIDAGVELGLSYYDLLDWLAQIADRDADDVAHDEASRWAESRQLREPLRPRHMATPGAPIGPFGCTWEGAPREN